MNIIANKITEKVVNFPKTTLLLTIIITIFFFSKVSDLKMETNIESMLPKKMDAYINKNKLEDIDKLINPGEKIVWKGGLFGGADLSWFVESTKDPMSDNKIKEYIEKFGCSGQDGTVYLRKREGQEFITFSKESGILSDEEKSKFIVGSSIGAAPLKEEIFWVDQFGKQNW